MSATVPCVHNRLREVAPYAQVCYFLGAGFSAATAYSFPTSVGFFTREIVYRVLTPSGDSHKQNYERVRRDFKGLLDRIENQYGVLRALNLETVLTDLYVRANGVGRAWEESDPSPNNEDSVLEFRHDYETILGYIELRLRIKDRDPTQCPLAQRLVGSLKAQDSILTLNYDTIIERHLEGQSKDSRDHRLRRLGYILDPLGVGSFGYTKPMFEAYKLPPKSILAKLHGSIDWFACPNSNCPNHLRIHPTSTWYGREPQEGPLRCSCCGWDPQTVIIPPTIGKAFEQFPNLNLMWAQAYHALRWATRWVFIGVSFAPTDFHLSALLRSVSHAASRFRLNNPDHWQVCVVNKDDSVVEHLFNDLSPRARSVIEGDNSRLTVFNSVEAYLDAAASTDRNREEIRMETSQ